MNEASYLGLAQAALAAGLLFAGLIAVAASVGLPWLRPTLLGMAPSVRARVLLALSALPLTGAIAGLLAVFLPSLLSWAGWSADHCHHHADHLHLCLEHPPHLATGLLAWTGLLIVAGMLLAAAASWTWQWLATQRIVARLLHASDYDAARGVYVVRTGALLALAAGLRDPRIFISSGMQQQLSPAQAAVVIAHERAHASRRDALALAAATALARLHLPGTRAWLLYDLALAAEQACDEAAFERTGDRLGVAETIVAVEKLFAHAPTRAQAGWNGSHFNGSNVPERVLFLLGERPAGAALSSHAWAALGATVLGLALLGTQLHHATESLLGLLFH